MYMHVNICEHMHVYMHTATSHIYAHRYICFLISCWKHVKHIHTWKVYTYVCAIKMQSRSRSQRPGAWGRNDTRILYSRNLCLCTRCALPQHVCVLYHVKTHNIAQKGGIQVENKTCMLYSRSLLKACARVRAPPKIGVSIEKKGGGE